jgi:hypothetical protein
MTQVNVIVVSAEEADAGIAEFWYGADMVGMTAIHEGQLHVCIDSRAEPPTESLIGRAVVGEVPAGGADEPARARHAFDGRLS